MKKKNNHTIEPTDCTASFLYCKQCSVKKRNTANNIDGDPVCFYLVAQYVLLCAHQGSKRITHSRPHFDHIPADALAISETEKSAREFSVER